MIMESAHSAKKLLDEISSESLQHLFSSVRFESSPPGSTDIAALDAHLFATARRHPSSGSSLNCGDIIEIQGVPASGKTHLLYHLIITCISPCDLRGWAKAAIILDTDRSFDILRLKNLFLSRLTGANSSGSGAYSPEEANSLVIQCLRNLHVFRISSSTQLAATLLHLPEYHTAHLPDSEIGLLAIDSISAFYWPDRFTAENHRSAPSGAPSVANPLQHVLVALQTFRASHMPVIVLTNWGLSHLTKQPAPNAAAPVFYRQHLHPYPNPFGNAAQETLPHAPAALLSITHHITMSMVHTPLPYPSNSEESSLAENESAQLTKWPEKAAFMGLVRTPGNSRLGRFTFHIGKDAYSTTG
ncbi:hypothetical protein HGRIS_007787 [Hohenbuehelia grisea]|uniref:RecA family profile 1 domain-containing protein n=1 Tax=Hohenbuehelia grisea TaxID=104357 RepID=A0ABR3J6B7_9AGAR